MDYILKSEFIENYMTGGNSVLTIRSTTTGKRFTFKIKCDRKYKNNSNKLLFVSVLTGTDNTSSYSYIGMIKNKKFQLTNKSKFSNDAPSVIAFTWFSTHVFNHTLPEICEVFHQGRCGRCGKKLTVPESIESGLGPECMKRNIKTFNIVQPKYYEA